MPLSHSKIVDKVNPPLVCRCRPSCVGRPRPTKHHWGRTARGSLTLRQPATGPPRQRQPEPLGTRSEKKTSIVFISFICVGGGGGGGALMICFVFIYLSFLQNEMNCVSSWVYSWVMWHIDAGLAQFRSCCHTPDNNTWWQRGRTNPQQRTTL